MSIVGFTFRETDVELRQRRYNQSLDSIFLCLSGIWMNWIFAKQPVSFRFVIWVNLVAAFCEASFLVWLESKITDLKKI